MIAGVLLYACKVLIGTQLCSHFLQDEHLPKMKELARWLQDQAQYSAAPSSKAFAADSFSLG